MEYFKKHWKAILLVALYVAIAIATFVVWFDSLWHLWYVDLITGLVILIGGSIGGYFYAKMINNDKMKKEEAKALEAKAEIVNE